MVTAPGCSACRPDSARRRRRVAGTARTAVRLLRQGVEALGAAPAGGRRLEWTVPSTTLFRRALRARPTQTGQLMAQRQTLPVLPLRGTVIFPGLTAPI